MDKQYVITLVVSFLFVFSWGLNNAYSVFIIPLADTLNTGRGTITLGGTIAGMISGFLGPMLVRIMNRYSFRLVIAGGTLVYSLIMLIMGFTPNAALFLFVNVLKGFLMVVYNYNIIVVALGNWFVKGRQMIIGTALAFSGLSGAIFSPIFSSLVTHFGLHAAFIFYASMLVLLALPAMTLLRLKPEEYGLKAYGQEEVQSTDITSTKRKMVCPFTMKSSVYILLGILYFIIALLTNVSAHLVGYAESIGFAAIGATMLSSSMIGNVIFKTIMGSVCDHFGEQTGYPVAIAVTMLGFAVLLFAPKTNLTLLLGAFLYGGCYSCIVVITPFTRYAYGDAQYFEAFSKVIMVGAISSLAGPMIGYLYDFTGSYAFSLYVSFVLCILALVLFVFTLKDIEKHRTLQIEE